MGRSAELDREAAKEPFGSPEQVVHSPLQVLSPDELRVQGQYLAFNQIVMDEKRVRGEEYVPGLLKVLSEPRIDSYGTLVVDVEQTFASGLRYRMERFILAERGVVPYSDGRWHPYGWLERTESEEIPTEST